MGRIVYGLAFLQDTDNISIFCTSPHGATTKCDKAQACDSSLTASYFFDTQNGRTNFITEVPQLLCYSSTLISLQGTAYFVGFTLGSLLWMRLADLWGRKRLTVGGLLLFIATLLIYPLKMSVASIYVTLFLFGLGAPLTLLVSYLLLI